MRSWCRRVPARPRRPCSSHSLWTLSSRRLIDRVAKQAAAPRNFLLPDGKVLFKPTVVDTGRHGRYYGVPKSVDPRVLKAEGATVVAGEAARDLYLNPSGTYLVLDNGLAPRGAAKHASVHHALVVPRNSTRGVRGKPHPVQRPTE